MFETVLGCRNSSSFLLCVGFTESGGPAQAETVRSSSCAATVSELPEPGRVALTHMETDETTHAGEQLESCHCGELTGLRR